MPVEIKFDAPQFEKLANPVLLHSGGGVLARNKEFGFIVLFKHFSVGTIVALDTERARSYSLYEQLDLHQGSYTDTRHWEILPPGTEIVTSIRQKNIEEEAK